MTINPWLISSAALLVGVALVVVGSRPRRFRPMAGALGAFPVRTPFGKLAALVVAVGTLPGAWSTAEHFAPPVQWADKSLYAQTWKDSLTSGFHMPFSKSIEPAEKSYRVWTADVPMAPTGGRGGKPLTLATFMTDELYAAKLRPRLMDVSLDPKYLHRMLGDVVYHREFFKMFQWPGLVWFVLSFSLFAVGVNIDLRRLREARNLGVHLEGNREVPLSEWNRAARGMAQ